MDIISLNQLYTYDTYCGDIERMKERYRTGLKVRCLGKSLDQREIFALYAGRGACSILLSAGVHGRESNNTIVLMKMLEQFLQAPREGYSLCVVPLVNPDGYSIALEGKKSIRNTELRKQVEETLVMAQEWKGNARGVDINRNFPSIDWKKTKEQQLPASEPETRIMMDVMLERPFSMYLDIHSRGEEIYYFRHSMGRAYNKRQKILAKKMAAISGYRCVSPQKELDPKSGGGNTVHFTAEYGDILSFTIETMKEESTFPLDVRAQQTIWEQIRELPFIMNN